MIFCINKYIKNQTSRYDIYHQIQPFFNIDIINFISKFLILKPIRTKKRIQSAWTF